MGTHFESFLNSLVIGDTEGCRAGVSAIERVKIDTEIRNLRDEIFRSANSLLVGTYIYNRSLETKRKKLLTDFQVTVYLFSRYEKYYAFRIRSEISPRIRGRTSRSMTEVLENNMSWQRCFLNLVYNSRTNGDDLFEEFGLISIRRRMRTWVEHGSRIDIRGKLSASSLFFSLGYHNFI